MTDLGKLVALSLKHGAYTHPLEERLREWLDLFGRVVRAPGGVAGLEAVGRYLLEVNDLTVERLRHVLGSADLEALEAVMTGAERLLEQGRAEGEARGRAEMLLKLLALKFPQDMTDALASRVRGASVAELERWAGQVLSAESIGETLR